MAITTLMVSSLKATAHGMDKQQCFRISQNVQSLLLIEPPLPPIVQAGGCYQVTCTSFTPVTKTLAVYPAVNNVAAVKAPSDQNPWVIEFKELGTIKSAYSCFDDKQGAVPHN